MPASKISVDSVKLESSKEFLSRNTNENEKRDVATYKIERTIESAIPFELENCAKNRFVKDESLA